MEAAEYRNIFENEETHFYYRAVHNLVITLVQKFIPHSERKILDAGCGTGLLAKKLMCLGRVTAIDMSPLACELSQRREVNAIQGGVTALPFPANTFDAVVSIDVIYHKAVEDDAKALSEMARVLKPGGFLILRVPAVPWLRSQHDKFVHTRERYGRKDLAQKL